MRRPLLHYWVLFTIETVVVIGLYLICSYLIKPPFCPYPAAVGFWIGYLAHSIEQSLVIKRREHRDRARL